VVRDVTEGPRDDDAELVAAARSGDERAVERLVRRHQAAAFRVAARIVGDDDAAADATQDAFLKAIRSLDTFRGDAAFRSWLLAIVANEARGALRRRKRRREVGLDATEPRAAPGPGVATRVVLRAEVERLRRCLAELPEKQRLAVALRLDEGLSFREVGEVIDSSEGAARVNYHHGIRRLREMMEVS